MDPHYSPSPPSLKLNIDYFRYKKKEAANWDTLSHQRQKASALKDPKTDEKSASAVNLDPRSDLSDEDEMINALIDTYRRMSGDENRDFGSMKEELKAIRETVSDSLEDILEETENEMNLKLDGLERHQAIEQVVN